MPEREPTGRGVGDPLVATLRRLEEVMALMPSELWLPQEFVASFVDAFYKMKRLHDDGRLDWNDCRQAVHRLAVECYGYEYLTLDSRVLSRLRALDLEIGTSAIGRY